MKQKNIPNLNIIRAIAILMILAFHTVQWLPEKSDTIWFLFKPGKFGVIIFFTLSGFLNGNQYFREHLEWGNVEFGRFIARKLSRIWPVYIIALLASYAGSYYFEGEGFDWKYIFLLQNYSERMPYFMVSWTLCVEEHFYFIFPFLLAFIYLLASFSKKLAKASVIFILLIPLVFRCLEFRPNSAFGYFQTASHFHFDALAMGILMAWICLSQHKTILKLIKYRRTILITSFVFLMLTNIIREEYVFLFGSIGMAILFSLMIAILSEGKQYSIADNQLIQLVSKTSYSIYLTHAMVIQAVMKINNSLNLPILLLWTTLVISSLTVGYFFYKYVEKPLMKIRSKLIPARGKKSLKAANKIAIRG